jgi:hypothetical protein
MYLFAAKMAVEISDGCLLSAPDSAWGGSR